MKFHKPPFLLKELKLEVTYKCPLACAHCSSEAAPNIDNMIDRDKCLSIIEEANALNVKEIAFSGGEPLIYESILDAIALTIKYNILPIVYTSGYIDKYDKILDQIKDLGSVKIIFSLYGADETTHQWITRINGSFRKTVDSIRYTISQGYDPEIHFVSFKGNFRKLKEVVNFVGNLGIRRLSVLRFVPQGRGALFFEEMTRKEYIELKRLIESSRKLGFDIRTGSPFNFLLLNDQPTCSAGIDRIFIDPHLNIHPCDAFKQISSSDLVQKEEFSNLNDFSLEECWNNSPYLKAIRNYLTTDFAEPCASCQCLDKCLSGCLAQKVIVNKDLRKCPDPICLLDRFTQ